MGEPWFIKHKPMKFTDLEFVDDSGFKILAWLKHARKGSILGVYGPVGCGKTSLVYAAAKALGYSVVEFNSIKEEELKILGTVSSVDSAKQLLLVDEADTLSPILPRKFFNLHSPVIFTSTNFIPKDIETLKILPSGSDIILSIIKRILKSEVVSMDDRFIVRLCELCNYDVRSVINYCQAFSKTPELKDITLVEKVVYKSITAICRLILSRRMPLAELEKIYSENVMNLCVTSVLENSTDPNVLRSIESISEISALPDKFAFMSLDSLNRIRSDFVYKKEEVPNLRNEHGNENPIHFLPLYQRNLHCPKSVLHLQEIFMKYQIKDLSLIDQQIKDYVEWKEIKRRVFRYKYSFGSSSAVKQDMNLKELMNI